MGFFTCILILIVLYCPWLIGVIFVVAVLAMIFSASPVLFFLLLGGAVILMVTFAVNILIDSTNEQEEIRRKRQQRKLEKKKLKEKHGKKCINRFVYNQSQKSTKHRARGVRESRAFMLFYH